MSISVGQPTWTDEMGDKPRHGNIIYFYDKEERSERLSTEQGRPIFVSKTYIHKSTPGDSNVVIERPVRDQDKADFAREWQLYEQKQSTKVQGTPLDAMPWLDRLQCAEIKALNIHTVEQLIDLAGVHQSKIMGYQDLKRKAESYLKVASDTALLEKKEAEAKQAREEVEEKNREILELQTRMKVLEQIVAGGMVSTDRPRKAGRPRKVHGADTTGTSSPDL